MRTSSTDSRRRLSMRLDGREVTVAQAKRALDALSELVGEVGRSIAGPGGLRWIVSRAEGGSFGIETIAEPAADRVPVERAEEAVASVMRGFAGVQAGAERPEHFSDTALVSWN